MRGANRSKVGHLAGICNAADAVLWLPFYGAKTAVTPNANRP
ncbi:hypothetical protein HMPREF9123_2773 [Neisseria bacilliformis ATCC BAA-1200]|uniref:Uncharacterized protein n=1 Tax=Neisseria bacilliformis ATCC BAA-1200 TaxID=888742 RepID=F2BGB6_9NEIS|nr:hypothetical protein HMPREF9123_2773 [Neisseria bacilliformis ATCC BAA-1200]